MGRVRRQKDPDFFAAAARAARDLDWVWVGGGDEAGEGRLRAAGVRVTGWLERSAVLDELATADVYVHTAAWEGAPLSILEAARAGCPVVARKIAPLRTLEPGFLASNPSELAGCARKVALDASMRAAAIARGRRLLLACNRQAQADALRAAYHSRAPSPYRRPVRSEAVECGAE